MDTRLIFAITFIVLLFFVVFFDLKYKMLRDMCTATKKPYSYSRVQLAWWSVIILSSFISIMFLGSIPTLNNSTLILLGISVATLGAAKVTDISDQNVYGSNVIQNQESESFLLDILSDSNGVSIHRFQTVIFNIVFGVWFIVFVLKNLINPVNPDLIMPDFTTNNLILLGLSTGTYAAIKTTENKSNSMKSPNDPKPDLIPDEAINPNTKEQG